MNFLWNLRWTHWSRSKQWAFLSFCVIPVCEARDGSWLPRVADSCTYSFYMFLPFQEHEEHVAHPCKSMKSDVFTVLSPSQLLAVARRIVMVESRDGRELSSSVRGWISLCTIRGSCLHRYQHMISMQIGSLLACHSWRFLCLEHQNQHIEKQWGFICPKSFRVVTSRIQETKGTQRDQIYRSTPWVSFWKVCSELWRQSSFEVLHMVGGAAWRPCLRSMNVQLPEFMKLSSLSHVTTGTKKLCQWPFSFWNAFACTQNRQLCTSSNGPVDCEVGQWEEWGLCGWLNFL